MSGLRGAIAFALAFDAQGDSFFAAGNDGAAIFSCTVFIVFFTIFAIGSPTAKILMKLDVLQGADSSEPPLTGRSARLMMLDEKYLGRYILHPRGKRPAEIEMQALGIAKTSSSAYKGSVYNSGVSSVRPASSAEDAEENSQA